LADALGVDADHPKYFKPDDFQEQSRQWAQSIRKATFDVVNFNIHIIFSSLSKQNLNARTITI
jgi:hypothetical protein